MNLPKCFIIYRSDIAGPRPNVVYIFYSSAPYFRGGGERKVTTLILPDHAELDVEAMLLYGLQKEN